MRSLPWIAPLTEEDFSIWDRLSEPFGSKTFDDGVPLWGYQEAHLADAYVMRQGQLHPIISGAHTGSGEIVVLRGNLTSLRRAGLLR